MDLTVRLGLYINEKKVYFHYSINRAARYGLELLFEATIYIKWMDANLPLEWHELKSSEKDQNMICLYMKCMAKWIDWK